MSVVREQEKTEEKIVRVPLGGPQFTLQLSPTDREGFVKRGMVPYWFNDQDGRIERAKAAGYKFVDPKFVPSLGSSALGNQAVDSKVKKVVSKGEHVIHAYLMETTQEFWNEDQALKEERNAQVDEALAAGGAGGASIENQYGPGVTFSRN